MKTISSSTFLMAVVACLLSPAVQAFGVLPHTATRTPSSSSSSLFMVGRASADADFAKAPLTQDDQAVDPNVYNVNDLELAAQLWQVSLSSKTNQPNRPANTPFLDTKPFLPKDPTTKYVVDNVVVQVSRTGGLGMQLWELAGGRDDGCGITLIEGVSGNAEAAGVLPGDSLARIQYTTSMQGTQSSTTATEMDVAQAITTLNCECRDFDATMEVLTTLPPPEVVDTLTLTLKRLRTWPQIDVVVEYPPSQCAPGVDNKVSLQFWAGENLRQGLLTRGIVMEDPRAERQCDFCGSKACVVKVDQGMPLLSPLSTTETKLMKYNPKCRLSCKTVVGYNLQQGNLRLKLNVNEWTRQDAQESNPFFSR